MDRRSFLSRVIAAVAAPFVARKSPAAHAYIIRSIDHVGLERILRSEESRKRIADIIVNAMNRRSALLGKG